MKLFKVVNSEKMFRKEIKGKVVEVPQTYFVLEFENIYDSIKHSVRIIVKPVDNADYRKMNECARVVSASDYWKRKDK